MKAVFSITTMILYIAGFVIVLFFFVTVIYPALVGMLQGECWGVGVHNTIKTIKSEFDGATAGGQEKEITVTLGDCVEHIAFVDKDSLNQFYLQYFLPSEADGIFKCPKDFNTYIIIIPYFQETKTAWYEPWKLPKDWVVEEIEKIYKNKFKGVKPFCEVLSSCKDCYYDGPLEKRILPGSRKIGESRTYCLTMKKKGSDGKGYEIDAKLGGC